MQMAAISVQNLSKNYGALKAVDDLSFKVQPGDFLAFLGPNGAGKTTTIHCITGLCNYQSGAIRVFGHDTRLDYRMSRRLIGLCPQEINLDPFLNIEQVLVYQAGYFGIPRLTAKKRAEELLRRFKLWEKRSQDFRKLSGGMKRRLLLCRALIHEPKILILDEPTAGADLELRHHIWDYLLELNRAGTTIFLTTHYMEEAEKLAHSVIIVDKGKIVHEGDKKSIVQQGGLEDLFLRLTKEEVAS